MHSEDIVREIIQTVGCHTPTVCLSALSLTASGIEPEELLAELKTCGLNIASGEDVELYKDNDFTDGLMIEHLRKLLQLGKLSNQQLDILRNLSLLPVAGVLKNSFKNWMKLDKAECFLLKKDYGNAVKKREKAISILEKLHIKDADMRTASLLSNLYNNLSNTYLLMKCGNEAARALRTAFDIRMEYARLRLAESHDFLQQMMNLINMLLLAKDVDNAKIVLEQYETLVLKHLSDTSLDYGICKLSRGIIDMMEGKPEPAEINQLRFESIIGNAVGTDNDYMKTTYRYLNNLYARWKKPEKAIEYRNKFLGVKQSLSRQE